MLGMSTTFLSIHHRVESKKMISYYVKRRGISLEKHKTKGAYEYLSECFLGLI